MSAFRESTSSNFADVRNLEVADNTGASKCVSEIDFELTDLITQDATPASVASSTTMSNKKKLAIDTDETKHSYTSKEHLQMYTKGIENLRSERDNALEKIKKLEKELSDENLKDS